MNCEESGDVSNSDMTAEALCERLLIVSETQEAAEREALLRQADGLPECVPYLLQSARGRTSGDAAGALQRARLGAELAERGGEGRLRAQAWRLAGQVLRVQGDHATANTALERAADGARQAGDTRLAAQVQIGRVDSLNCLGRYDEAIALARRLDTDLRAQGENGDAAKVLVNLGALYYRRDQYPAALACYERALETFTTSGELAAQATVQTNVAAVLMELHRANEAIALYETARATFAAHDLPIHAARIDANVGFLHHLSGRYAQAINALLRGRAEFEAGGQTLDAAKCDADVAEAYRELNLYPEALEAYTRAAGEMQTLGIVYERARMELGRASVYIAQEQFEDALRALDQADVLFAAQRNSAQRARVRLVRAHLLNQQGRRDEARHEAQRAARALTRSGLRGWAAEARLLLAEMASEDGLDVSRSLCCVRRVAQNTARGWLESQAERALGRHHISKGNVTRGLRHLQAGVRALEQARTLIAPEEMHVSFLRDKLPIYEETVSALLARGRTADIARALEYVEQAKSRLLLERVQAALENRAGGEDALPSASQTRLAALRAELSRGYYRLNALDAGEARRSGAAGVDETNDLNALEQEYAHILRQEEQSQNASAGLFTLPAVIATEDLKTALLDNQALLEYYTVGDSVCAWVVTSRNVHFRPALASLEDVNHVARRLRYQLQRAGWAGELSQRHAQRFQLEIQSVLAQLYDLLLRPIKDLLGAEQLIVVPHASLHGLPFHAFYDGAQSALDRWEISYAPSAALWYRGVQRQQADANKAACWTDTTALLVSVPSPGILQVTEEVAQLARLLPNACVLDGLEATLANVRAQAPACRLLHLATHATYRADNPLFSGLQLADGWLLARDLYAMRLNCGLATLSACQTGVALADAGDELFGLVRGFLASGVRSVAASLWPADDQATSILMQEFYQCLGQGQSKAAALRRAQQAARARFPHPYHWAAFALIGERGDTIAQPA